MSREIVLTFSILDCEEDLEGVISVEPSTDLAPWIGADWTVNVPVTVEP